MAKNYEVGEKYYLPVNVEEVVNTNYGVKISFEDGAGVDTTRICELPDVLLTADEIAIMPHTGMTDALEELKTKVASLQEENEKLTTWYEEANRTASEATEANDELKAKIKELRTRNAELDALLKEVMATRDEAIKQNDELLKENGNLKEQNKWLDAQNLRLKDKVLERTTDLDNLMKDNENLKADCDAWKDTADERIVAVQTLSAENDKLKAENDNLRGQIGKLTTSIQNLASDVKFYKTDCDKWLNTAQDNAKLVDALQEENKSLKQELKDAEGAYNVAADTSIKRNNRVKTMEEVIVALVEKIRRLEGGEQ